MSVLQEAHDDYAFHFLDDIRPSVAQLLVIGKQTRIDRRYYWDNRGRRACFLFQYTLSGSGSVRIDGQEHIVDEGKAFFLKLPGEECYYFDEEKNTAPWSFIYIMFTCGGADGYCRYIESHLGNVFSLPVYHEAIQLLLELHSMAKRRLVQDPFLLSSRVFAFLCLLCSAKPAYDSGESELVLRAKEYFEGNYMRPVGISDAADFLGVTQSHLSREFCRATGAKPIDYLTKLRLKRAVALLSAAPGTLEDIRSACGFSSVNYFTKVFKKHMSMTPRQFRSHMKQEGYASMEI